MEARRERRRSRPPPLPRAVLQSCRPCGSGHPRAKQMDTISALRASALAAAASRGGEQAATIGVDLLTMTLSAGAASSASSTGASTWCPAPKSGGGGSAAGPQAPAPSAPRRATATSSSGWRAPPEPPPPLHHGHPLLTLFLLPAGPAMATCSTTLLGKLKIFVRQFKDFY
ncbi:hypothetical protein BS78_09G028200 [Paspalum vaginatum]|nr:hypothetical protein BS78_09G028200 [Paspalum vaginatum]